MTCRRCPHHVRHGQASPDGKNIVFKDRCGLMLKLLRKDEEVAPAKIVIPENLSEENLVCKNYPFPRVFDYVECDVYKQVFKGLGQKNDVVPTKDFQYSDVFNSSSITDLELL